MLGLEVSLAVGDPRINASANLFSDFFLFVVRARLVTPCVIVLKYSGASSPPSSGRIQPFLSVTVPDL